MHKVFFFLLLFVFQFDVHAQQGTIIRNGNVSIYYKTFGKGKLILLINGGPGMNSNGFDGIAKLLSKNNMTITYDQRGTGRSILQITDSNTISMNLMVEDIEALRNHLKIDRWIILGHSFGGMLAAYYATIHPENIESLILSSAGGIDLGLLSYVSIQKKLSKQESDSLNYWNKKIEDGDTSYHARLQRGMALAPAYVYNRKNIPVIAERLTQGNSVINVLVWNDMQKIKFDCTKKLSAFNKPVLIIQGKNDIIEEKTALLEHKVFKNSTLVFLDHTGHYGWLDNEDQYLSVIRKFLSGTN
jgi:proline iminopeptidase